MWSARWAMPTSSPKPSCIPPKAWTISFQSLRATGIVPSQVFSCGRLAEQCQRGEPSALAAHDKPDQTRGECWFDILASSGNLRDSHSTAAPGRQGQLCVVGGASRRDAYRDSWAHQEAGGIRRDAHHGHRQPHAFGWIPSSVPRPRCETALSARHRTAAGDR